MMPELLWAKEHLQQIIAFRRELHRFPEPSCNEFQTHQRLRSWLQKMDVSFLSPADNITIAVLEPLQAKGPVIGIRCDTDALEVEEQTGLPYQSENDGIMHACGHDAHMAMGLGACMYWKEHPEQIKGAGKVIFQPAEEGGGGAQQTVRTGLLDDVHAFLGLHVWPQLNKGQISISDGPLCSCTDILSIRIHGRGGHGAYPNLCADAVTASAALVMELQHIVSRFTPPMQPVVLTLGSLSAGTRWNVIAEEAQIEGTLRTFDDDLRERILTRIREIVEHIAAAHQCRGEINVINQAKLVLNDPLVSKITRAAACDIFVPDHILQLGPVMIGDDFSEYRSVAPSCYALLGVGGNDRDYPPLHHGKFTLDEDALALGTAFFCHAVRRLQEGNLKCR